MAVNNNLHYNGTIRADWWNYYEGIYFITMTVKNRIHAFGEIHRNSQTSQNNMIFSKLGQFVNDEIPKIMDHYPYVFVPSWVVMPDHVHLIIMIDIRGKTWKDGISKDGISKDALSNQCENNNPCEILNPCGCVSRHAPTINDCGDDSISNDCGDAPIMPDEYPMDNIPNEKSKYMSAIAPKCGSLGLIIGRFKGAVTKYANDNHIPFRWQSRFYDSIIFDQAGFERVRRYINNNVANWKSS